MSDFDRYYNQYGPGANMHNDLNSLCRLDPKKRREEQLKAKELRSQNRMNLQEKNKAVTQAQKAFQEATPEQKHSRRSNRLRQSILAGFLRQEKTSTKLGRQQRLLERPLSQDSSSSFQAIRTARTLIITLLLHRQKTQLANQAANRGRSRQLSRRVKVSVRKLHRQQAQQLIWLETLLAALLMQR